MQPWDNPPALLSTGFLRSQHSSLPYSFDHISAVTSQFGVLTYPPYETYLNTVVPPLQYAFKEVNGSSSLGDGRHPSLETAPPLITLQIVTLLLVLDDNL
jgi:hypothetical protein